MSEAQRPLRIGKCYWRKPKGSISPDIIIVKNRQQPPSPQNTTHCVDMKFGRDVLSTMQSDNYAAYFGSKLMVLYFPRECQTGEPEEQAKEGVPDWVKALMAALMLIATRGRSGSGTPTPRPVPAAR